jgi:hypothetical protein
MNLYSLILLMKPPRCQPFASSSRRNGTTRSTAALTISSPSVATHSLVGSGHG